MKRIIITLLPLLLLVTGASAQKNGVAVVDMQYILKNVPAYESASEQLNQITQKWKKEIDASTSEAKSMYENYQTELVFLSKEMQVKRENEIVAKEKATADLKRKYFGQDGELYKKREALLKPIQDEVYSAVKAVADAGGYSIVLDKTSAQSIVYVGAKSDISDEVLTKLGYAK
ncbi:MAG: OmpH family outer membrane protein [Paludibacteraceae bacterium]|nr:OmpH family outer membrane protein [Paludibacteraceae bacterium]